MVVVTTRAFGLCQLSAYIINKRSKKKGHWSLHSGFPRLLLDWLPFYRMKGFLQIRSRIHSCWKLKAKNCITLHNGWNLKRNVPYLTYHKWDLLRYFLHFFVQFEAALKRNFFLGRKSTSRQGEHVVDQTFFAGKTLRIKRSAAAPDEP